MSLGASIVASVPCRIPVLSHLSCRIASWVASVLSRASTGSSLSRTAPVPRPNPAGYLSTQYALAHPERVRRLVLVSPVGWAAKPQGEHAHGRASGLLGCLWDSGVGNFGLLRTLGRVAKETAKRAVVGRFGIDDEEERALVADYFWATLVGQPVSAEQTVNHLLEPYFAPAPFGFYAKRPVSSEPAARLARLPPTTLLYGRRDLHYIPTMPQAIETVRASATSPISMAFCGSDHHLYLDSPAEFHSFVSKALA